MARDAVKANKVLSKDSFKANLWKMPKEFLKICGYKQKAEWYSPKAEDWGTPFADLVLMSVAINNGQEQLVQYAWLGELAITRSLELMLCRSADQSGNGWMLPLGLLKNGAVVAWPFKRFLVPGTASTFYFWPQNDHTAFNFRDLLQFVWDPDAWEAAVVKWRSPLANFSGIHTRFPVHGRDAACIIPFETTPKAPLLKIVADEAFFDASKTFISRLAKYLKADDNDDSSLLALTESCVKKVSKPAADTLVDILEKRSCA